MRRSFAGLALLMLLLLLAGAPHAAARGPDRVTIEVHPNKVGLSPSEKATVLAVVRNGGTTPLRDVRLTATSVFGASVSVPAKQVARLASGTSATWNVQIQRLADHKPPGQVLFKLTYRQPGAAGAQHSRQLITSLSLDDRALAAANEVLDVKIDTKLAKLQESRPGDVYVTTSNVSDAEVTLERVDGRVPTGVRLCAKSTEPPEDDRSDRCPAPPGSFFTPNAVLSPGATQLFRFRLEATDRVRAGGKLAVFQVTFSLRDGGIVRRDSVVVTHPFETSVLGESDFLTAVGVPSFLLLPGFLALMAFRLPGRHWGPTKSIAEMDLSLPEYAALSATLSVLAIPLFWLATWLAGDRRTYLDGYGVRDLITVWLGSVLVGTLAFGVPRLWSFTRVLLRTPRETDTPKRLLVRLRRNGSSLLLPQLDAKLGADGVRAFKLPFTGQTDGSRWIAPPISYRFKPQTEEALKGTFVQAVNQNDVNAVLAELRRLRSGVTLAWKPVMRLDRPVRVDAEAVVADPVAAPRRIVELP